MAGAPSESSVDRRVLLAAVVFAVLAIPAILGRGVIADASDLYPLAAGPSPYFVGSHAFQLYVRTPVVVVSSFVTFLAPGMMGALLFHPKQIGEWGLFGFFLSVAATLVIGTLLKLVAGTPMSGTAFFVLWGLVFAAATAVAVKRRVPWPLDTTHDIRRLAGMLVAALVGVAVLIPKIFWDDLNIDGAEAFEFGRSLTHHVLPNWELHPGTFGFYNNFVLFSYVNHWFFTLFGEVDAAARVPMFLYVPLLFAALVGVVERGAPRRLNAPEELLIWGGIVLYTFVQVYNSTYEPYSADLAETGATDTLWVLFFVGTIHAMWAGRKAWMCALAYATYMSSPGSPVLLAALAALTFVFGSDDDKALVRALAITLACGVLMGVIHHFVYIELILGGVKDQFSARNMASRLFPPNPFQWKRFAFLVFPSGVVPALSFFFVRPRHRRTFITMGVTLGYFGLIYVSAWTGVHQFTPVMVLPLIVFWRMYLAHPKNQKLLAPAYGAGVVLAMVLSVPPHFEINQAMRTVAYATDYRIGDYGKGYEEATANARVLYAILPEEYRMMYPEQPWGGDHLVWIRYALTRPTDAKTNYVVQATKAPQPTAMTLAGTYEDAAIYVRDPALLEKHKNPGAPRVSIAPIYEHVMFEAFEFFRSLAK